MNNTILLVIVVLLTTYFIWMSITHYTEVQYVKSNVDNHIYTIRSGKGKGDEYLTKSADTLAELNIRIKKLVDHVHKKHGNRHYIKELEKRYHKDILSEAAIDSRYTTYTIDKEDMHVCLRTRDDHEQLYDINLLVYVLLHELAHLANYSRSGQPIHGHGKEFSEIFKLLTKEALAIGIYRYENYYRRPVEYCGMTLNSHILNAEEIDPLALP